MSEPLVIVEGVAAALLQPNIDTDVIAPTVRRHGTSQLRPVSDGASRLFAPWRYDASGAERTDFVLNRPPFRESRFLITGQNFACGSSRETAASWLRDFGIRCVMAESFGGIFYDNCFRNGILPLQLPADVIADLAGQSAAGGIFRLDLQTSSLSTPAGSRLQLTLPAFRRRLLMTGGDEIAITHTRRAEILAFQAQLRIRMPWIWPPTRDPATPDD